MVKIFTLSAADANLTTDGLYLILIFQYATTMGGMTSIFITSLKKFSALALPLVSLSNFIQKIIISDFMDFVSIFHLARPFSPSVGIFTSCGHSHSGCAPNMPLPPGRKSSHVHHNTAATSHLAYSPPCKNNIFHLTWKNSPKNHKVTPIPSIRYL